MERARAVELPADDMLSCRAYRLWTTLPHTHHPTSMTGPVYGLLLLLLLLISPFGPRGLWAASQAAREAEPQSLPIIYVTNADGRLHRSGVACVWACVWECGPHTYWL